MFYILAYLSFDDTLASFPSANNVQVMMGLGAWWWPSSPPSRCSTPTAL